ncbi:chlorohydrolase [Streptococcus pneumoniae]|nr:chlorohydrolase [Streptococcus pneumoniae]
MVFRFGVNNWGFKEIENKKPSKNSIAGENEIYSMKIKEQTRKLAVGCSKHCFEVVDETDRVSNHTYGKATLTRIEEIFEEYKSS